MSEIKGRFPSCDGKNSVAYTIWEPEGEVRAVLQISHGMIEHRGRYADFAEYLNTLGIAVGANDHLGHGETAATPDDLGFFADNDGYLLVVEDLHKMTVLLREKYPDKPLILMGHSMGSFVARLYLATYGEEVDAAIIMGTAGPGAPTGLGIGAVNLISAFKGERHRSKFVTALAFGSYLKRIPKPCDPMAWTSREQWVFDKRNADPYCNFIFTLSAYRDLFSLLAEINNEEWAKKISTDLPILMISGDEDPVGNYGKGVRKVASMLAGAGAKKLTVKLCHGDRHEVLNETDREDNYKYIAGWLDETLESLKDNTGAE